MKKVLKLFVLTMGFSSIAHIANSMYCCQKTPLYGLGAYQSIWCYGCGPGLNDGCSLCNVMDPGTVAYYYMGSMTHWEYTSGAYAREMCCGFPA